MDKKGILFVDDEPNILSGIKRMLRSMRKDFDFYFAEGGQEALEILSENSVDVVVSDMRMPGMDGVELLSNVQENFPNAVRIMLTGQADDESIIKTVGVVHQFLSKPSDPDSLKDILIRSAALQDLMDSRQLKEMVSSIGSLPSLPNIYTELQKVLRNPDATAEEIAKVIEKDISMTAKLLQLVNSSFFGLFQKVESADRAVMLLGVDVIKNLALGMEIFSEVQTVSPLLSTSYLWEHSIIVAQCSKKIAMEATDDTNIINSSFIAGMLHDIGRLLLLTKLGSAYVPIIEKAGAESTPLLALEKQTFNATHCDIGAYLIGLWGFNNNIVEAIAFHNTIETYPGTSFSAALAVHVADAMYYKHYPQALVGGHPGPHMDYLKLLGYDDRLNYWSELCEEIIACDE